MKSERFWKLLAISVVLLMVAGVVGAVNMTMNSANTTENETLNSEELSGMDASSVPINKHPKMSTQVLKHVPPSGITSPAKPLLLNIYLTENKTEYIEELKSYTIDIWYVEDYTVVAEVYTTEIELIADLPFVSYIDLPHLTMPLQSEMGAASDDIKAIAQYSSVSIVKHPKMSTRVLKHIPPPGIAPSGKLVLVNIYLTENKTEYVEDLNNYNINIWYLEDRTVVAEAYPTEIKRINELPYVSYIDTPFLTMPLQSEIRNTIEAVKWFSEDNLRNRTGGEGVKIAVLGQGFFGYENANLPEDVITESFREDGDINGGSQTGNVIHGTACAEVVHAVAPEAKLYLVNYLTDKQLIDAVNYLIKNNVDIISHSMGSFWGAFDGTDPICLDVIDPAVFYDDIIWVNAAGNHARRHWEGTFNDTDGDGWHEFPCTGGEMGQTFYAKEDGSVTLCLSWNDTWGGATQDYDLYITDSDGEKLGQEYPDPGWSNDTQCGRLSDVPYEFVNNFKAPYTGTYYIKIQKFNATKPVHFELYSILNDLDCGNASSSLCVEATAFGATVAGAVSCNTLKLEKYSSQGPTNDGRTKPDFVAPVGYDTSVYLLPFNGTSAAAPHVAADIALYLAYVKNLPGQSDNQSAYELFKPCLDEIANTTEKDNQYGFGLPNFSICYGPS
jgi:subtilisin family serine protease